MADATGVEVVRLVAQQVENAHDRFGDAIEASVIPGHGAALDALSALAAAAPLLRLGAAGNVELVEAQQHAADRTADAVGQVADRMADDLAEVLGAPSTETWDALLRLTRERAVPFGQTVPTSALLLALGAAAGDVESYDASPAAALDRVREVVKLARDRGDEARAERARINAFAGYLADALGILLDASGQVRWGTPEALDLLLDATRRMRATLDADVLDVATALGYLSTGSGVADLAAEGRRAWSAMMDDIGRAVSSAIDDVHALNGALGHHGGIDPDAAAAAPGPTFRGLLLKVAGVRDQLADIPVRIAAALGLVGGESATTLDGVLDLVRQQTTDLRRLREQVPAGPTQQPGGADLFTAGTVEVAAVVTHPAVPGGEYPYVPDADLPDQVDGADDDLRDEANDYDGHGPDDGAF